MMTKEELKTKAKEVVDWADRNKREILIGIVAGAAFCLGIRNGKEIDAQWMMIDNLSDRDTSNGGDFTVVESVEYNIFTDAVPLGSENEV